MPSYIFRLAQFDKRTGLSELVEDCGQDLFGNKDSDLGSIFFAFLQMIIL